MENTAELPQYQHLTKPEYSRFFRVGALEIAQVEATESGFLLTFAETEYAAKQVTTEWHDKYQPEAGGYFVIYPDGKESYFPAETIDEKYTRIW